MKITSRSAALALLLAGAVQAGDYDAAWQRARDLADQGILAAGRDQQKQFFLEAEQAARQAVRLQPSDSKGHAFLAVAVGRLALFEGGRHKVELSREVKTAAEQALALNPNDDMACHTLALWHRELVQLNRALKKVAELLYGRFPPASLAEAIRLLRREVELAPDAIVHRVELGRTLVAARQWAAAKQELDAALALLDSWITDNYYRELAKQCLNSNPHKF